VRERIGSYRIERVLAEGGMGLVYKGRHENLGRDAAIKTLRLKDAGDAALRERLLREARAQARLQHPNIVTVYDLIDENGELFIAMEYVEGETLAMLLQRWPRGRLTLDEALPLFDQVLVALEYVHGEKIIHRDVKPSNVMVCGSRVKLADFGIALLTETPRITTSMRLIGSPPYMSPEQLEARNIDHRSDIYSAAIVLYRMLAGRAPFEAKEYLAQIHERAVGPSDLRTLAPSLPAGVAEAIAIALRYDRDQRFRSVAAFRDALREGAVGFLVTAPSQDDVETVVSGDAMTEPLGEIAPEPETRRATTIASVVIAGTFIAASSVILNQAHRQSFPAKAPPQKLAVALPSPAPIVLEAPPPAAEPPQPVPRPVVVEKNDPFPPSKSEPAADGNEDGEAKRRRELEALREAIRRGLALAGEDLGAEHFDAALEELDRIAELAQRDPAELSQERVEIAQLRTRVVDARVAAQTRIAEEAQWASRLAEIEEDLRAARWPEAERFATGIARDPRAPQSVAERARALLEQAKEGRRNAFKDIQLGPTRNTIRKPSSPPRK
jgi:serine/threonine protein kinase